MSTPFVPPGPEFPTAPIEIPTPNLPPNDFISIGAKIAEGAASGIDVSGWLTSLLNWIPRFLGAVLGVLLGWIELIIAYFLKIIFKIWNNAENGTDAIAAAAISGIFKVPVSPASFQSVTNPGEREGLGNDLVAAITTALGAGFTGSGAQSIAPSSDGANKFMQTALNMAIEGWLQGWLFEAGSLGFIKHFGDLKDILERSLGIGRLSRRVMGPPVKVLVEDPFLWLLHQTYRPTQLPASTAIREFVRGNIDQAALDKFLGYAGIPTDNVPGMINEARPHLPLAALQDLVNAGYMTQEAALQELQNDGWTSDTAAQLWQAEQITRQKALAKTYVDAAEQLMVNRKMDQNTFNAIVDGFANQATFTPGTGPAGVVGSQTFGVFTPAEATMIKATAQLKRGGAQQLIPLGQALSFLEEGLITLDDYRRLLILHGFPDGQPTIEQWSNDVDITLDLISGTPWIELWELWATKKSSDVANAAATKAASAQARALAAQERLAKAQAAALNATADAEAKGVSIAKYETLVKDGLKTIADYQLFLKGKGLSAANITAFTTVLQAAIAKAAAAGAATAGVIGTSKAKALSLAQLEAAVKGGFISLADFQTQLETLGYTTDQAALLAEVLQAQIAAANLKASVSASAQAALGERRVSLADEERAVILGLQTIDQYTAMLKAAGFAPEDTAILVGLLTAKVAEAQAAAAKKAAAAGIAGTRHLNLSQVERLVRSGQLTTADYQTALTDAGYDAESAAQLVKLLDLQLAYDQHLAAASGRSSVLLTAGGLSLSDVARAVKLGIVPIGVYDSALAAAGVTGSDAATLHASLVSQIAAAASTPALTKRVSAILTAASLNLTDLERSFLSGQISLQNLAAQLSAAGVAASDVAALSALMEELSSNQAAVAQLTAGVTAAAAAKGLTLSQEATAVKAGAQTIEQYEAFVKGLGYDATDAAILVASEAAFTKQDPPADATPPLGQGTPA